MLPSSFIGTEYLAGPVATRGEVCLILCCSDSVTLITDVLCGLSTLGNGISAVDPYPESCEHALVLLLAKYCYLTV